MSPSSLSASSSPPSVKETVRGTPAQPAPNDLGKVPVLRPLVVLALAVVVGLTYWFDPPLNTLPQAGVILDLPTFVGNFFGKEGEITDVEKRVLPKDTEFARRIYDDSRGHQLTCSIVLSGSEGRSIHRPEACLPGQGWTIVAQDNIPVPLASEHKLMARRLSLERQVVAQDGDHITVKALYIYWFVGQNVTTPSEMERVLLSNWDRVFHNANHRWAYVSFFSYVTDNLRPNGLDRDQTQAMMVDFAKQIVPTFQISEMPAQAKN
jgi:hypothetical protein